MMSDVSRTLWQPTDDNLILAQEMLELSRHDTDTDLSFVVGLIVGLVIGLTTRLIIGFLVHREPRNSALHMYFFNSLFAIRLLTGAGMWFRSKDLPFNFEPPLLEDYRNSNIFFSPATMPGSKTGLGLAALRSSRFVGPAPGVVCWLNCAARLLTFPEVNFASLSIGCPGRFFFGAGAGVQGSGRGSAGSIPGRGLCGV